MMFDDLERTAHELWAETPPLRRRIYLYAVLLALVCVAIALLYWRAYRAAELQAKRKIAEANRDTARNKRLAEEAAEQGAESERDLDKIEAEFELARAKEREAIREMEATMARIKEAKRWEELRKEYDRL